MRLKKVGVQAKMLMINLLPILFLGIVTYVMGTYLLFRVASDNMKNELYMETYLLKDTLATSIKGDYTYQDGVLSKGSVSISDSHLLDNIKNKTSIDVSLFWDDLRVMSTVRNNEGVSAVGYRADPSIVKIVLEDGEDCFQKKIYINERSYIGFYTPLENDDGTAVGMVAAIIPTDVVYRDAEKIILYFFIVVIITVFISVIVSECYTKSLLNDIDEIKKYLFTISNGDFTKKIDEKIINRKDEFGEIAVYAMKMNYELKGLIELDPLTLLYNRRICHKRLQDLVAEGKKFTIVMCDIDWFKRINDNYGHACGDYVLKETSRLLRESVGNDGIASRWGGEEFLLVYELEFEEAKEKVEELATKLRNFNFEYNDELIHITMTFGVKKMQENMDYEKIINMADHNLYEGKRQGRDCIIS